MALRNRPSRAVPDVCVYVCAATPLLKSLQPHRTASPFVFHPLVFLLFPLDPPPSVPSPPFDPPCPPPVPCSTADLLFTLKSVSPMRVWLVHASPISVDMPSQCFDSWIEIIFTEVASSRFFPGCFRLFHEGGGRGGRETVGRRQPTSWRRGEHRAGEPCPATSSTPKPTVSVVVGVANRGQDRIFGLSRQRGGRGERRRDLPCAPGTQGPERQPRPRSCEEAAGEWGV